MQSLSIAEMLRNWNAVNWLSIDCVDHLNECLGVQRFEHVPIQQTTKETSHIGPTLQRLQHAYSRLLENRKAVYCGGGSFLGVQKVCLCQF